MAATQFLAGGQAIRPPRLPVRRAVVLLLATLLAYQVASATYVRSTLNPIFNPVLVSVRFIISLLLLTGTPYRTYFDGAQLLHSMLGPATVALAIPLYAQIATSPRESSRQKLPCDGTLRLSSLWFRAPIIRGSVRHSPACKGCRHRLRMATVFLPRGAG